MMIENPFPSDWRELQAGVCRIFNEIGLMAEQGKVVVTPRGSVELDVYAVDEKSVDKVSYVVECKNWSSRIPQSVVHSFTTVMHEVGANVGYIISREGLQSGAVEYIRNTNIRALTCAELQQHYFDAWFDRCFVRKLGYVVGPLTQYIEPFNSWRDAKLAQLDETRVQRFGELYRQYQPFGMFMAFFESRFSRMAPLRVTIEIIIDIDLLKRKIEKTLGSTVRLHSVYYRELLAELAGMVNGAIAQFDEVFGGRIFET